MTKAQAKLNSLIPYLKSLGRLAVAYSGGVDSTLLLKVAKDTLYPNVIAITVNHLSFTGEEAGEARSYCGANGIKQIELELDELSIPGFKDNTPDRCYICKKEIFSRIRDAAAGEEFTYIAEGSNRDDEYDYRPGLRAIEELDILSPFRYAGFTKADIRELSASYGLPTAQKPSASCLATRIPYGEEITREKLAMVERAERWLKERGFNIVRVRAHEGLARIEVEKDKLPGLCAIAHETAEYMRSLGFNYVTMDLQGFCSGSMNRALCKDLYGKDSIS